MSKGSNRRQHISQADYAKKHEECMGKIIKTNKMSRVTRTTKAGGGHIKVSTDAADGKEKPYLGYRRGRGMPGAHEPVEEFTPQARKTYDKAFKQTTNGKINNAKVKKACDIITCDWHTERKISGCNAYPFDITKCPDWILNEESRKKSSRKKR